MIKMGWEDIIKRPFDVSRAREEALEDYDKTLSNIQIMKKYLDPYFNASVRGGSRIMSGENRWYDTGEIKRIKPGSKTIVGEYDIEDAEFYEVYSTRRTHPRPRPVMALEMKIPTSDWESFPKYVQEFIMKLEPEYIENKYKIKIMTIGSYSGFSYVLRYRKVGD